MKPGRFIIQSDGKTFEIIDPKTHETTGMLTVGEALEQIIWLFEPSRTPFPMKTKREWEARYKRLADPADFIEPEKTQ
jgi:hypothetical protein